MAIQYDEKARSWTRKETTERRNDIAYLLFQGYSAEEITVFSEGYSADTVEKDIEYIESHQEEFLG